MQQKKMAGYQGVCLLDNDDERMSVLSQLEVSDVWQIGRKTSSKLKLAGINNSLQLSKYPLGLAKREFNVEVQRTISELNKQSCIRWDSARADKEQIFSTRSVGERIVDIASLRKALSKHVGIASRKARQQHLLCKT